MRRRSKRRFKLSQYFRPSIERFFLSFAAYFVLFETTNAIWMQILVNSSVSQS
jgi:hypothetical protein